MGEKISERRRRHAAHHGSSGSSSVTSDHWPLIMLSFFVPSGFAIIIMR